MMAAGCLHFSMQGSKKSCKAAEASRLDQTGLSTWIAISLQPDLGNLTLCRHGEYIIRKRVVLTEVSNALPCLALFSRSNL